MHKVQPAWDYHKTHREARLFTHAQTSVARHLHGSLTALEAELQNLSTWLGTLQPAVQPQAANEHGMLFNCHIDSIVQNKWQVQVVGVGLPTLACKALSYQPTSSQPGTSDQQQGPLMLNTTTPRMHKVHSVTMPMHHKMYSRNQQACALLITEQSSTFLMHARPPQPGCTPLAAAWSRLLLALHTATTPAELWPAAAAQQLLAVL